MGTQNVSLPVVAGNVGAAVAVDVLGPKKLLIVTGVSGAVTVEASDDGSKFCPAASFSSQKSDEIVVLVAKYMRINASGGNATSAQVVAERGQNRFAQVPSPPTNGPGASVDVTEFGCLTTVTVSGISGNVGIEVSADNINWTEDFKTFTSDGCDTKDISARFVRAVGKGGTASAIFVGSSEADSSALTEPCPCIVYRPGATGDDAPGGNVYTTWEEAYAALEATKHCGTRFLEFDSDHSTHISGKGPACPIPAGNWDFTDVIWTNKAFAGTIIDILDGAVISGLQFIRGTILDIIFDGVGSAPFTMDTGGLTVFGPRTRFLNTHAGAAPMFSNAVAGGFFFIACAGNNTFGGIGDSQPLPAPIIDIYGGFCIVGLGASWLLDNALTDTSAGQDGTCNVRLKNDGAMGGGPLGFFDGPMNWDFPNLPATASVNPLVESRDRHLLFGAVSAGPYQASYNELVQVDTTGGPVQVDLPRATPAKGERVVVKDVGGNALAANITVAATGGDTVEGAASVAIAVNNQAQTFVDDGFGNWMHIATS